MNNLCYINKFLGISVNKCCCTNWDGILKVLSSPGIDSKESVPPAYVAWQAEPVFLNLLRSPGLNVYKYGLWYDHPIATRFLVPTDCSKIPAPYTKIKCTLKVCMHFKLCVWTELLINKISKSLYSLLYAVSWQVDLFFPLNASKVHKFSN